MAPLLFLLLFLLHRSSAIDRIGPGESIAANETLSSGSGAFVLGFFSPSNSPSKSYLGIWRNGSDVRTAVWVANREAPVPLSRAVFRLSNTSNLEVADSNGTLLWSSDTHPSDPRTTVAVLLDSGSLNLLRRVGGALLWQSFDDPTDTVLPGMPIWVNYKTRVAATAVSWRSPVDPSPGEFRLSIDPDTPFQGIVMRGSAKWWRGNVWDGVSYTTRGGVGSSVVPYLSFKVDPNSWNLSFTSSALSGAMAVRLEYNGTAVIRIWSSKAWVPIYTFNSEPCESYGLCGAFGYCSPTPPTCRCLDGFEPRNRSEWDGGDYRGGCVRRYALGCDGKDELVKFEKMKLPDYNTYLREIRNGSACMEVCRSNCSCVAYAYSDLWTGSETMPRCMVWTGEQLFDLVARNDSGGEDLYVKVRVDQLPMGSKKDNKVVVVVVVIVALLAGVAFLVVAAWLIWKCKKRAGPSKKEEVGKLAFIAKEDGEDIANLYGFSSDIDQSSQEMPFMDYETLLVATNNFSDANTIGQGGFGKVYKGNFPGGAVAIKRLSEESGQGLAEFRNEVILIAQLQHRNLVKLLSCCIHEEEKLLIYEYMPNRSLELLLFDSERQWILDWGKRFNIIKGIARGLLYLHEDSRLKIIHRDLKASNILLDGDLNPKISDFGMARIFDSSQSHANTKRIVGTYGYISPEYAMGGLFSVKSDVYSFGVLLLELISGRKNTSFRSDAAFPSLLSFAWESWRSENLRGILAPSVRDSYSLPEVAKCIHIGLLCVQDEPVNRPNMSSVVFMLENETPITLVPEKPTFTGWACQDDTTQQSVNSLSTTVVEGR